MAPNDNFISRGIQSGVSAVGGFAGGVVDSAGKTVQNSGRDVGNRFAFPASIVCPLPPGCLASRHISLTFLTPVHLCPFKF